jgi:hypothetical protein
VIPVSAENPFSGAAFGREILEACDEFGRRIGAPEIHARELIASVEEVHVPVHESGRDQCLPVGEDPSAVSYVPNEVRAIADREDGITASGDTLRPRRRRISGPHPAEDDEVGRASKGGARNCGNG